MDDAEFDKALIGAVFAQAGATGWARVSVADAARRAGLSLVRARERAPGLRAVLLRFGRMADAAALADPPAEGTTRDRLFYLLMQRVDVVQAHRAGVLALMRALPFEPATVMLLDLANRRSMRWMLEAAGVATVGFRGEAKVSALVGVWVWTMRAWSRDTTDDMSGTMSALDGALGRVERLARWMGEGQPSPAAGETAEASMTEEPPVPESPPPPPALDAGEL
jgi:ubiquinone biosynthesis protein COQ9